MIPQDRKEGLPPILAQYVTAVHHHQLLVYNHRVAESLEHSNHLNNKNLVVHRSPVVGVDKASHVVHQVGELFLRHQIKLVVGK